MPLHFLQPSVRTKRPFQRGSLPWHCTVVTYWCTLQLHCQGLHCWKTPLHPTVLYHMSEGLSKGLLVLLDWVAPALHLCTALPKEFLLFLSLLLAHAKSGEFPDSPTFSMYGTYGALHFESCCLWPLSRRGHRCEANPWIYTQTYRNHAWFSGYGLCMAMPAARNLQAALDNLCPVGETFAFEGPMYTHWVSLIYTPFEEGRDMKSQIEWNELKKTSTPSISGIARNV